MIRAIVLPQPEASLVVFGLRQFTKHSNNVGLQLRPGERLAIVSKSKLDEERAIYQFELWHSAWSKTYGVPALAELPLGRVVGTAVFGGSAHNEKAWKSLSWRDQATEDFNEHGFALRWRNVQRLAAPLKLDAKDTERFGELLQLSQGVQDIIIQSEVLEPPAIPRLQPMEK